MLAKKLVLTLLATVSMSGTLVAASEATTASAATASTSLSKSESAAKKWIAWRESKNSYSARNGMYYGKYQLSVGMLQGDYSAANQERVADRYAISRYGSWSNAKRHFLSYGWY